MVKEYFIKIEDPDQFETGENLLKRGLWFLETDMHKVDNETFKTYTKTAYEQAFKYLKQKGLKIIGYASP